MCGRGGEERLGLGLGLIEHQLDEHQWGIGEGLLSGAAALEPAVAGGGGVRADDDGLTADPAKLQLFGLAFGVLLAGLDDVSALHGGPVFGRDAVDDLEASVSAGCDGDGLREVAEGRADFLQDFGGADAVVIDEQQATGGRASDDADGLGAAAADLSCGRGLVEGVVGPVGLIGALVVADGDEGPVIRESLELLQEIRHGQPAS